MGAVSFFSLLLWIVSVSSVMRILKHVVEIKSSNRYSSSRVWARKDDFHFGCLIKSTSGRRHSLGKGTEVRKLQAG